MHSSASLILIYLIVLLIIGFYAGKATKNLEGFLLAGRRLGPFINAMTLQATWNSASAYMGIPALLYVFGWSGNWIFVTAVIGLIIPALFLAKWIREKTEKLGALTQAEYLGIRYDSDLVRIIFAVAIIVFTIPMLMAQYKGAGILFNVTLGIPLWHAVIIGGIVIAVYTSIGGFLAVAWTDTFQGILMFIATFLIIVVGFTKIGGLGGLNSALAQQNPELLNIFDPKMFTGPLVVIGAIVQYLLAPATNPNFLIRYFTIKDSRSIKPFVRWLLVTNISFSLIFTAGLLARGLLPGLQQPDMAVPSLVMHLFPEWLAVLIMCGILAAVMSTVDSLLITTTSALVRDIYQCTINQKISEKKVFFISRILTLLIGVLSIILTLTWAPPFLTILVFLGMGFFVSGLVGPQLVGMFWKRSTKWGAIASTICGPTILLWLHYGLKWNVFVATLPAIGVGLLAFFLISLCTVPPTKETIEKIFGPTSGELSKSGTDVKAI